MKKSRRRIYALSCYRKVHDFGCALLRKTAKPFYLFLAVNLLCILLLLVPVSLRRLDLKKELEADREFLRTKEERFQMFGASRDSFDALALLEARLEKSIQPEGRIAENVVGLCSMFEESGLELTGCFAGEAEKIEAEEEFETAGEYGIEGEYEAEKTAVLKQIVSLEGYGAVEHVYDFIDKIENPEVLYRVESLRLTAGSEFSEDDISLDVSIAMFAQTESSGDE